MNDTTITTPSVAETNSAAEKLFHQFRQVMMCMARAHHQHGHAHHAQNHVLHILKRNGPTSQRDLMGMLRVRSASLSELLGKLERGGLITRERDQEDRRGYTLGLTAAGDAAACAGEEQRQSSMERFFTVLSPEEHEQLGGLLEKLVDGMEAVCGPVDRAHEGRPHGEGRGRHDGHGPHGFGPHEHGCGHGRGHGPEDRGCQRADQMPERCMRHEGDCRGERGPRCRAGERAEGRTGGRSGGPGRRE
ncbi:MarR family winged helix-turn-helix transcriptional regulator [Desulfovibrio sp. OttesenSCG-928-I05]|nr:MarR family winged helix-turn-helix transcriptional regulator [Desulfovibrio sp. OttesenSCG-928-I05]